MWIGYEDVDRLITYPDAHNLSGCSQPIRMFTTYPDVHNLSACAPGEVTIAATWAGNTQPIRVHAGRSAPKGHPEHWAECRVDRGRGRRRGEQASSLGAPNTGRRVYDRCAGIPRGDQESRGARPTQRGRGSFVPAARTLWWDPWAPKRCDTAPRSSYRLVSMATRQPVVPQILKE